MDQGRPHSDCTSPLHRGQYQLIEGEKQECEEHLAFVKDSLLNSRPEKHASKVERGLAGSSIRERKPSGSTVK